MVQRKNNKFRAIQDELMRIVQKLKTSYKPEKIILFGSLARGKITDSSDIDLIIVKRTTKNPWMRLREVDSFIDHNFPVDFLVYTPKEFMRLWQSGDSFFGDIVEKGKVLYER